MFERCSLFVSSIQRVNERINQAPFWKIQVWDSERPYNEDI